MLLFNIKLIRNLTKKSTTRLEKEKQKDTIKRIEYIKESVKRSAKQGKTEYVTKLWRDGDNDKIRHYFIAKGFRVWEDVPKDYCIHGDSFLHIAW